MKIFYDYMDYRPKYPQGKDTLIIVQVAPHNYAPLYRVISGEEELNCYPGSDNVFNAILFFLYEIKSKKNGIFGANHRALLEDIFRY